jgi:DNA sulfur modification protein DndD
MILRSIQLENFGLYAGENKLDLVPGRRAGAHSPIILIGGKNGAGKTTMLEAVRLALYGRRALGARVGQTEYEDYLRNSIHRGTASQSAAVELEFDYAEAGIVHHYRVRREWSASGKKVFESLQLEKDNKVVDSVPREEWHSFLQELIPPGVSQLFFFDGEKISEIAEGEEENEHLAEAVRSLLGIELVGRLRTDLGLYLARHQRDGADNLKDRLEATIREISILEQEASALTEVVADLSTAKESQARAAEQVRRQFIAEGGDAAVNRARLEADREDVRRRITRAEHDLRALANGLLPFAMAPRLTARFQTALAEQGNGDHQRGSFEALREALGFWRAEGAPPRNAKWTEKHWTDLDQFIGSLESRTKGNVVPAFQELGDGAAALARLRELEVSVRPRAAALLEDLDRFDSRLKELEKELTRADNAASGLLLDELRLADQRLGSTEATLRARQEELKAVRGQLVTLNRERERLLKEQAGSTASVERLALAARSAQALAEYERRLLEHKITRLRGEFVQRFNHLARKGDLIADVRIDPKTFAATLIDRFGHEVPKVGLSAGEKQVYAIAMLWALARTSGRPLPMIIDTPLGRLDSDHRANLIERYFPAASHQVILLSTDTEIDESLLSSLGPSVSHTYRLDYDPNSGRTVAQPGYFEGKRKPKEATRALQQA